MKRFNHFFAASIILFASLFLFSCKKQVERPLATQSAVSSQTNNAAECNSAVFGVYSTYETTSANAQWLTLAQKWYSNGKVKFLKAKSGRMLATFFDPYLELMFNLDWAEVSYHGNQVYLTDVLNNRMFMRVTLDNLGRPEASYLYNIWAATPNYWYDTTYYYYNGDRLDHIISLFENLGYTSVPYFGWRKYQLSYDSYGDLIKAETSGPFTLSLQYDYSKPVTGMISNFQLTASVKLLEYMELLELPMHYALTKTDCQPVGFPSIYKDYVITDGLVRSYSFDNPYGQVITFYNGWDCGASLPATNNQSGNAIANLKQFQELYNQ